MCRSAVAQGEQGVEHHGAAAAGPLDEGKQALLDHLCHARQASLSLPADHLPTLQAYVLVHTLLRSLHVDLCRISRVLKGVPEPCIKNIST